LTKKQIIETLGKIPEKEIRELGLLYKNNPKAIVSHFVALEKFKQKEKQKSLLRQKKGLLRNLPQLEPVNGSRRVREQLIPFRVTIALKVKYHWLGDKTDKLYDDDDRIINTNSVGEPLRLRASSISNIRGPIQRFLNDLIPQIWDSDTKFPQMKGVNYDIDEYTLTFYDDFTYTATLPKKIKKVNKIDVRMKLSNPYKIGFLNHFKDIDPVSYQNHQGECVLKTLARHWKLTEKFLNKKFDKASQTLYKKKYNKKDGISSSMIREVCKELNTSCLGFDQSDKEFIRYRQNRDGSKKYKAVVFYMAMEHFYIMTDEKVIRSLTHLEKGFSSDLKVETKEKQEQEFYYNLSLEETLELPHNSINIIETADAVVMNRILAQCVVKGLLPKRVKHSGLSSINEIHIPVGEKIVKIVVSGVRLSQLTMDEVKLVCKKAGIPFKNQGIGTLLTELQTLFFEPKRKVITDDMKKTICSRQENTCNHCKKVLKEIQYDHIQPVSGGGLTTLENLQALCPECHREKSADEHTDFVKRNDFTSCLNMEAMRILKSKHHTKLAFSHFFTQNYDNRGLKCIDVNGCRRNLAYWSSYQFPVYSVLDKWESFDGEIKDGNYYVETDQYFPFRKNGVYSRPLVEFGLKKGLITKDNIKKQFIPSLFVEKEYFKKFIDYLFAMFSETGQQKLAVNSWVGCFGRRDNSFIESRFCKKDDYCQLGEIYQRFDNPFQNQITDDLMLYTNKYEVPRLETGFYIHSQILDMEAIVAYELYELVSQYGVPICVKTDAIVYVPLFGKGDVPIENYFWDEEESIPTIPKYKFEEADLLKQDILYSNDTPLYFDCMNFEEYKEDEIYADNDWNHIADVLINSGKGVLIEGNAGTGKSTLFKKIFEKIEGSKYVKLAPTNISAFNINGETLDKFCHRTLTSSKQIKKTCQYDYIFVDEISMVRETFYQVLLMIKNANPSIKFIIAGDFDQLPPVQDRIQGRSYKWSRALYELVDGQKMELTKCKRSDDVLFELCKNVKKGIEIDTTQFSKNTINKLNICFTNEKRKAINKQCIDHYGKGKAGIQIEKYSRDDNSQTYRLFEGMPMIARKTTSDFMNTEMFKVSKITDDMVILKNEYKSLEIEISQIKSSFHPAFAITTHKSQGATFKESYTIHEWKLMNKKLKYVSLSRATDIKNICIL
jgi:hypothetical protein